MSTAAQIMDLAHRCLYQIAIREEQHWANNNGNVPRGFCALWRTELVAAESV